MRKIVRFYKEGLDRWYADIPEWTGSKSDLEMVAGADTMLDYIAEGEDEVKIFLSTDEIIEASKLEFIREAIEYENGAFYTLKTYMGIDVNIDMWLCDVTKFVFGEFPKEIFLYKIY